MSNPRVSLPREGGDVRSRIIPYFVGIFFRSKTTKIKLQIYLSIGRVPTGWLPRPKYPESGLGFGFRVYRPQDAGGGGG